MHLSFLNELFELLLQNIFADVSKITVGVASGAEAFFADLAVHLVFKDHSQALAVGRRTLFQTTFLEHQNDPFLVSLIIQNVLDLILCQFFLLAFGTHNAVMSDYEFLNVDFDLGFLAVSTNNVAAVL